MAVKGQAFIYQIWKEKKCSLHDNGRETHEGLNKTSPLLLSSKIHHLMSDQLQSVKQKKIQFHT